MKKLSVPCVALCVSLFGHRGVCPRRHGIASYVRHWRRLRHQSRCAWHQLVGHGAFVIWHRASIALKNNLVVTVRFSPI